jgi:hypothetical protein
MTSAPARGGALAPPPRKPSVLGAGTTDGAGRASRPCAVVDEVRVGESPAFVVLRVLELGHCFEHYKQR